MRYAVGVPNVGDYGDPRLLVELARDAEAAGWDAVLLWDHTLDLLSGGRLILGAGLGSQADEEYAAFGEDGDARARAARLDEGGRAHPRRRRPRRHHDP